MANRPIGSSLEKALLAEFDAQGGNRSALVKQALRFWLEHRRHGTGRHHSCVMA